MIGSAVYYDSAHIQAAVSKALGTSDRVRLCLTSAPLLEEGPLWGALVAHINKVELVLLGEHCVRSATLDTFKPRGILRVAEPEVSADVLLVNFGQRLGVFVGSGLGGEHRRSTSVSYLELDREDEAACSAEQLFEKCRQHSALALQMLAADVNAPQSRRLKPVQRLFHAVPANSSLDVVADPAELRLAMMETLECLSLETTSDPRFLDLYQSARSVGVAQRGSTWLCAAELESAWSFLVGVQDHSSSHALLDFAVSLTGEKAAGLVVRDKQTNELYLAHLGTNNARSRASSEFFWKHTRAKHVVVRSGEEEYPVAILGRIPSPTLHENIEAFAKELHRIGDALSDSATPPEREEAGVDFLELELDEQIEQVWEALIGLGPVERDEAIRVAAKWLKDTGQAQFQRLRREGDLYLTIDDVLKAGKKEESFDSPKRGHIRACVEFPTDDMWRVSLLSCLPEAAVHRDDAIRLAAEYAAEYFGFSHQRLRRGGRVERAVKSAIHSCLRRKLIVAAGRDEIELTQAAIDSFDADE